MLSSSIPVMAQNSDQDKLLEAAVEQNEDFRRGVELASGKTPKYKEAIPFFEKAANSGLPIAMVMVGICYYQLDDLQKTVMWYTKAAEHVVRNRQFQNIYQERK
jgi:TPR repeat protein